MPVCVSTPVFDCVYKCIEKITEGHDSDTCRDLRRELPFSIKSFQFGDALFLVKAHGRLPPPSAGSLGCIHPHLPSAWFFSPPLGFTHFAMLVSLVVALGRKRTHMISRLLWLLYCCTNKCSSHIRKCFVTRPHHNRADSPISAISC